MAEQHQQSTMQRPYLLRAMHEWMTDNGLTPHIVIDAAAGGPSIAPEHVRDGRLVLNLSFAATRRLVITNERVEFEARFGGTRRWIEIPVTAVLGIYARETGQGMIFSSEPEPSTDRQAAPEPDRKARETSGERASSTRDFLKLVK